MKTIDDFDLTESVECKSIDELKSADISKLFKPHSQKGKVGLQNMGNTCFMNSGLQCLANTPELTKYFLLGTYKHQINKDNVLGMGGKLAEAYAVLMNEIWRGSRSKTAPFFLKKTLGTRISRFSGFG